MIESGPVPNRLKKMLKHRKTIRAYPSSYSTLARAANVARNTVVNLANGDYIPMLDTAYKLARALNVTVYDIWEELELDQFLEKLDDIQTKILIAMMEDEDEG